MKKVLVLVLVFLSVLRFMERERENKRREDRESREIEQLNSLSVFLPSEEMKQEVRLLLFKSASCSFVE